MIYRELISESKECENVIQQIGYQTGSRFPILCSDKKTRDFLYKKLNGNGIGASLGYICWMKKVKLLESFFKDLKDRDFSGAIELEDRLLTLPLHSKMTRLDVVRIVDLLNTKL
jgi:dTDP-4-amino-4,6-dideoxygalactose transaminase